jgi:hypothetical protein
MQIQLGLGAIALIGTLLVSPVMAFAVSCSSHYTLCQAYCARFAGAGTKCYDDCSTKTSICKQTGVFTDGYGTQHKVDSRD